MSRVLLVSAVLLSMMGMPVTRPALAEAPARAVSVRTGDHQGFGRVVFDLPQDVTVETAAEGDRILLFFTGADTVAAASTLPRNVLGTRVDGATATVMIAPGTKPRVLRMGDRVVVDVFDRDSRARLASPEPRLEASGQPKALPVRNPAKDQVAPPARERLPGGPKTPQTPAPVSSKARPVPDNPPPPIVEVSGSPKAPEQASAPPKPELLPSAVAAPVLASPVLPVERAELAAPRPAPEPVRPVSAGPSLTLLPADPSVGAAAFRRGPFAYVVLDRRIDLPLPAIEGSSVTVGPTTTVLELPLAPEQGLRIGRTQAGWTVERSGSDDHVADAPIRLEGGSGGIMFPLASPGRVVSILDPSTGGALLIGTSLASGPGTAVMAGQRRPGFDVVPTWLGVVVEPMSDFAELHRAARGFGLHPASAPAVLAAGPGAGRRFEFQDEPVPSLQNRLNAQMASAALAPPRGRSAPRMAAAQTMLAMGMDVEAQALLLRAINEDPQAAADAQLPALAAVAAVLAGRLDQAGALDDPRIQDSAEIILWRGVRDRRLGQDTEAARALPDGLALARAYPVALRRQIWPDLAEATIEAKRDLPPEEITPFAAALRLERAEKVDEALQAWQALADGADRVDSIRATRRLVELRLASGKIMPGAAADLLERSATGWRGDGIELALRLRAAELRAAAGQWRDALEVLRATDPLFPDQHDEIRRRKTAAFGTMLAKDGAGLSPLEVVLLASDYADCVPDDESGAALAALLADKLAALDLPARAIPVLQGLVKAKAPGPARAQFGVRLGAMMMEVGDAAGALTALDGSAADNLVPPLVEERAMLRARAQAALSHADLALAALKGVDTALADDLRATLLAKAGDWPGCLAALAALEAKTVPAQGALNAAMSAVIVRQAEAAQQIPDLPRLQALRSWLPRMTGAPADILRVLTTTPVTRTAELPRARTELALARTLPKHFEGMARP